MTEIQQTKYYYCTEKERTKQCPDGLISFYECCDWCGEWHRVRATVTWTVRNDGQRGTLSFVRST